MRKLKFSFGRVKCNINLLTIDIYLSSYIEVSFSYHPTTDDYISTFVSLDGITHQCIDIPFVAAIVDGTPTKTSNPHDGSQLTFFELPANLDSIIDSALYEANEEERNKIKEVIKSINFLITLYQINCLGEFKIKP